MSTAWFAPTAEEILRQDAVAWKKRALAAEGKLSGYRRLRENAEEVLRTVCENDASGRVRAIDSMAEELATLDVVDTPRDLFSQKVDLGGETQIEVRLRANLGMCSTLDVEKGLIEIESLQPEEGRAIGLLFQVLQLVDIAYAAKNERSTKLDAVFLHEFVPGILAICAELGFLNPSLKITGASIEAYIAQLFELQKAMDAGAASDKG